MTQQTKRNKEVLANAMTRVMTHIWDNEDDLSDAQFELLFSKVQELESMLCENPILEDEKDCVAVDPNETPEQTAGVISMEKLQDLLDIIKNGKCLPVHLTPDLENSAKGKIKSKCIGAILAEPLWDGSLIGKVSKEQLIKGIVAIRNDYPDLFVSFNKELPIEGESSSWTMDYFNKQRNLLRSNFALERLCHLVLVYEKLFCETTEEDKVSPFVAGSDDVNGSSCSQIRQTSKKKLPVIIGIVVVLLAIGGGIFFVNGRNTTAVQPGNEPQKDKNSEQSGNMSKVEAESAVINAPAQTSTAQMPVGNKQKEKPSEDTKKTAMPIGNKQPTKQSENKAKPVVMSVGDKTRLPSMPVVETK